jgi:hypothetical protein
MGEREKKKSSKSHTINSYMAAVMVLFVSLSLLITAQMHKTQIPQTASFEPP